MIDIDKFMKTPGMRKLADKIHRQKENEAKVAAEGGNKYLQLKARLTNPDTGKLEEDLQIYGVRVIKNEADATSFFNGYVHDIIDHPENYPEKQWEIIAKENPVEYAKRDMNYVLGYFTEPETHKLWDRVMGEGYSTQELVETEIGTDQELEY